jgi:putative methionine-R-sulfoxide reductase with GAF domain
MTDGELSQRLRDLLSVADASLSQLDVDEMLGELLWRVRGVLDADTAAVLLREAGSNELVARAACGLEEEVRQGVRVPVGTGFAGSIALTRRPVFLTEVGPNTVANPILWEKGIQVMLGVPLFAGDEVIGVLHVGRLVSRAFGPEDAELLQVAAERVAGAVRTRQMAVDAAASRLLERGLLPSRMPKLPGLQFASRYVPAERRNVGGDWYDAFTLPTGELWLVIGDVAGHGMNAAVIMGRVRSALRSYALLGTSPEQAMALTDHKVQHFEIGSIVTVLCATTSPPYDHLRICTAGHPPPVLARPGQKSELLSLPVGPPLGVVPNLVRTSRTIALPAETSVLLYTDGLVERRDESLDDRLDALVRSVPAADPEAVCHSVMHRMVGNHPNEDDIALLAMRRTAERVAAV